MIFAPFHGLILKTKDLARLILKTKDLAEPILKTKDLAELFPIQANGGLEWAIVGFFYFSGLL